MSSCRRIHRVARECERNGRNTPFGWWVSPVANRLMPYSPQAESTGWVSVISRWLSTITAMSSKGTKAVSACSIASEKCSRRSFAGRETTTLRQTKAFLLAGRVEVAKGIDVELLKGEGGFDADAFNHSFLAYLLIAIMCPDI